MAWKEIGRVPRADVEPLWQRFRAACDGLFAKRDAARDAESDARRAELESLRGDMEAVLAGGDDVAGRALAVRRRVVEMTERDVEPSAELRGLYEQMLRVAITEHGEALRGSELDPVAMASKRAKLIGRAEALLPKQAPAVSADAAPADIAAQLKQAMQANALFKGDGRDPYEVIEELRAEWAAVGPVVGDDAEQAAARFAEVSAAALAQHGGERPARPAREERPARGDRGDRGAREPRGDKRRERRDRRRDDSAVATDAAITGGTPAPAAEVARAPRAGTELGLGIGTEAKPEARSDQAGSEAKAEAAVTETAAIADAAAGTVTERGYAPVVAEAVAKPAPKPEPAAVVEAAGGTVTERGIVPVIKEPGDAKSEPIAASPRRCEARGGREAGAGRREGAGSGRAGRDRGQRVGADDGVGAHQRADGGARGRHREGAGGGDAERGDVEGAGGADGTAGGAVAPRAAVDVAARRDREAG